MTVDEWLARELAKLPQDTEAQSHHLAVSFDSREHRQPEQERAKAA